MLCSRVGPKKKPAVERQESGGNAGRSIVFARFFLGVRRSAVPGFVAMTGTPSQRKEEATMKVAVYVHINVSNSLLDFNNQQVE